MLAKNTIIFFIQLFFVQVVFSQCWTGNGLGTGMPGSGAYDGQTEYDYLADWVCSGIYPSMLTTAKFTPTIGGVLSVTSGSLIPPTGICVVSDNAYEGILTVSGELPFVGTTSMQGMMPSIGSAAVNHACGNGLNALTALSLVSSPASSATCEYTVPYGAVAPEPVMAAPSFVSPFVASPVGTPYVTPSLPCDEGFLNAPYDIEFTPTNGGYLPVSSGSVLPPTGLSVSSETAYGGSLLVGGELPFIGAVGVEGMLPTAGAGGVSHACGNGITSMASERPTCTPGYNIQYNDAGLAPASGYIPVAAVPGNNYCWTGGYY